MLVCRTRPRRLAALSFFSTSASSTTSSTAASADSTTASTNSTTTSTSQSTDTPQDSIFTTSESPWDHVFSDIGPIAPSPARRHRSRLNSANISAASLLGRQRVPGQRPNPGLVQRGSTVRQQRASLTAQEMSVFDEMFDMIFDAVSAHKTSSGRGASAAPHAPSSTRGQTPSIGRSGAPLDDIFRTLRRRSRIRWTTAIDEELDRKKETMELFNTDHDLLQWVTKEVFGEAEKWEEEVKRAMVASTTKEEKDGVPAGTSGSKSFKDGPTKHSIYPHLITHAMRIFRTTYSNPSLSLAVFNHAARASITSYVFGCTAPAYNELIEAKWEGWGDLEGVCNALEEMKANGVKIDGRTRIVVEQVRREVGEARPVEDGETNGDVNPLARKVWDELGEAEVMMLVDRIERLALRDRGRKSVSSPHEESWKSAALSTREDDGWSFDGWGDMKRKPNRGWTELAFR